MGVGDSLSDSGTAKWNSAFLGKWKGYPKEDWVRMDDMENAPELVIEHFANRNEAIPQDVQGFYQRVHAEREAEENDPDVSSEDDDSSASETEGLRNGLFPLMIGDD